MNTNFHTLWGKDIAEGDLNQDAIHTEYRQKWHSCPENKFVTDFPLFLDIEATSYCNLACPHCIQTKQKFKGGYMSWDMYKAVIDEASNNGCYGCKYHTIARGEPMLNPDLSRMISYAKKRGLIDVYLNTNAILLDVRKSLEFLDAGLDRISFSIDGVYLNYEKFRVGASFRTVVKNILTFMNFRGEYRTKVRIQTVRLPGVDLSMFVQTCRWLFGDDVDEIAVIDYKNMGERTFLEGDWICPQPWQRMSVLWDGSILPCNHDDRQYAKLGTFPEMSLKKAWHSSGMRMIRNMQSQGKGSLVAACNGCYLAQSEIKKI